MTAIPRGSGHFVRAFRPHREGVDLDAWPASGPAAGHLLREGLELPPGVTFGRADPGARRLGHPTRRPVG